MTTLFDRRYRLRLNNEAITELHVAFKVERTLKREPNTAEITVWNLSPDSRALIEEQNTASVTLAAGYRDRISLIFAGDLRDVNTVREGPSTRTTIQSGDGEKQNRNARVSRSYAPKTTIKRVIQDLVKQMGLGLGNLSALGKVEFPRAGAIYPTGTVVEGNVADELDNILRSAGLEYSIQDGNIQIVTRNKALADEAVVLSPDSGLVGTASVGSDGILHCKTLMIPDVIPGRKLVVKSQTVDADIASIQAKGSGRKHLEQFSGIFRAQKCVYNGDIASPDTWNIAIEADPLFRKAA